jgi:hypothetical protein
MTAAPALPEETRERLERLQALFIRLMFCERTLEDYRRAPAEVLAEFGLAEAVQDQIPDVDTPQFVAEARGRRELVRREVDRWFTRTGERLTGGGNGVLSHRFEDFLSSDFFYDPRAGLPHPSGVGPGYEAVSKYFFWLRDRHAIDRQGADVELRSAIHMDFAQYLMDVISRPRDPYFDRFTGGVYWPETPGQAIPVMLVTDQLYLFTLKDPEKIRQLAQIGLRDLDEVKPGEWDYEPNI